MSERPSSPSPSNPAVKWVEITDAHAGQRIDNFLLSLEKGVPKSRIYRAIRKGEVRVNKGRIKQTYRLKLGDLVRVPPLRVAQKTAPTTLSDSLRDYLQENILFEDDALFVLNKPTGLAVHAGTNIAQGVIEAMRLFRPDASFLELVHRLDRDTSGCLLLAKSRDALLHLQKQFTTHDLDKRYLTLLSGGWDMSARKVDAPLQRVEQQGGDRIVEVNPAGKAARTTFIPRQIYMADGKLLAQFTEVELHTGRTHQIRVHSKHIGHPIAGDDKYGDRRFNRAFKSRGLNRLFLHAWKITVQHPLTEQPITLEASLPEEFNTLLTKLSLEK